jgi:hypothetical protein
MCDIGGGDAPRIFNETYPVARKEHVCCECGGVINIGEKYQNCSGLWDYFHTYKTCSFCADVREDARSNFDLDSDEGFPFEELWECVGIDYAGSL